MEVQVKFISKATVWIRALVYDVDGVLVDPTTSIKVTVVDSGGTKQVDDQAMSKAATGTYDYYYTLASDADEGWWQGEVWTVDGTYPSCESFGFEVRVGLA
jgi:hypothetical protein